MHLLLQITNYLSARELQAIFSGILIRKDQVDNILSQDYFITQDTRLSKDD